jgi:hypothetical protein
MAAAWRARARGRRVVVGYAIAVLGTPAATLVLLNFRGRIDRVDVVLAFLMLVVAAAATGGLVPGLVATGLGFLALDALFIPPYRELRVAESEAYVSLGAYLLVTVVMSALVAAREQRRIQAEQRERQARTLYALSQTLVAAGDLDTTLAGVARTVRSLFDLAAAAVVLRDGIGPLEVAALDGDETVAADVLALAEEVVAGERRFFSRRPPRRRLLWRSARFALAFVLLAGLLDLPLSLPVLPASALSTVPLQKVNYNLGETIGWPELARTVARVYRAVPGATIVAENYGEAGAIARYGPALGVPRAFSGHNNYWDWGVPPDAAATIAIGFSRASLAPFFGRIRLAARIENAPGVENDEQGAPVWVCRARVAPWAELWPRFKHYG